MSTGIVSVSDIYAVPPSPIREARIIYGLSSIEASRASGSIFSTVSSTIVVSQTPVQVVRFTPTSGVSPAIIWSFSGIVPASGPPISIASGENVCPPSALISNTIEGAFGSMLNGVSTVNTS